MSTWTSRSRAATLGVAASLGLAGCLPAGLLPLPAPPPAAAVAEAPPLLAGAVTVAAPPGWCPDPRAGQADETGGFVLLGPCRTGPGPSVPAILTASVLGAAGAGSLDPERLDAFFRSEIGRAAISRSGRAESVTVVQTATAGAAYLLQVRDAGPLAGARVGPDAWRALLPLNGRLVALTVLSPEEPRLPPATLRNVLDAYLAAMQAANGPPAPAAP